MTIPPGHTISFKESLHIVSTDMLLKLAVPSWAVGLNKKFRRVDTAFKELRVRDLCISFCSVALS